MSVIAPRTSRTMPDDRADDVRRRRRGSRNARRRACDGRAAVRAGRVERRRRSPRSDLDDDREDHRPALRLLVQVARDAVLDLGLEQGDLADVVARGVDRLDDPLDAPPP